MHWVLWKVSIFVRKFPDWFKKGKNKRWFPIHSHFRKYSPLHFMTRAVAALVRTITSICHYLTECLIHNQHDFWGLFLGEATLGAIPVPLGFLTGIFGYCKVDKWYTLLKGANSSGVNYCSFCFLGWRKVVAGRNGREHNNTIHGFETNRSGTRKWILY